MEELYYVYGKNGWLSRSSQFRTDIASAREFTRREAIETCRNFKENQVFLVPVSKSDMVEINDQR